MKRVILAVVVVLATIGEVLACSVMPLELKQVPSDFDVFITHKEKPIAGIAVEIVPARSTTLVFQGSTDVRGLVHIAGLPSGEYYLTASHLGFDVGKQWLKVVDAASVDRKTVKKLDLQWADWSFDTRNVAGLLTGLVPGNTGNKLQDLIHPISVVYPGVQVELRNAFSDEAYSGVSDSSGHFIFGPLRPGTYVLTVAGGTKSMYGVASESKLILDVVSSSRRDSLKLRLQPTGCGGIEFDLDEQK